MTLLLLALAMVLSIAVFASPGVWIDYHMWRIRQLRSSTEQNNREQIRQHADRLVELGRCFYKEYRFEHLDDIDHAEDVLARLGRQEMGRAYHSWGFRGGHHELYVLDFAEREQQWDAFEERHNTPFFEERNAEVFNSVRLDFDVGRP